MNNEFIDGIWFAVQHIVVVRDMPAIAIGIIKESNLSIDDCKAAQKRSGSIYSKLGDEPLLKEGYEYNAIRDAVQYVTNKHDFGYFIQPWKDEFLRMPFDVTKRKKWADYVAECHATGKEIDYDNYDWDK